MIKSNGLYMSSVKSKKSVVFFFNHDSLFICLTAQSWPAGAGLSNMPPTLLGLAIALAWEVKLFYSPSLALSSSFFPTIASWLHILQVSFLFHQ